MRVITVRQPWATAIIRMGKDVENRSRNIAGDYRGAVAIHAGLSEPGRRGQRTMFGEDLGLDLEVERDLSGLLLRSKRLAWPYRLPLGAIIGIVDLVDVHHWSDDSTGTRTPLPGDPRSRPQPLQIRPCTGPCGRPTRANSTPLDRAPGTIPRIRDGKCRACLRATGSDT